MSKKKRTSPRGQGLLEFAMVLPFLLMLMYGLFEVGRMVFIYSTIISSSREAVRYGSAVGVNDAGLPRFQDCAGIRNAAQRVGLLAGIDAADITITYDHGPGTSAFDTCDGGFDAGVQLRRGDRINVTVVGEFQPVVPVPFVPLAARPAITSTSHRTILVGISVSAEGNP